MMQEKYLAFIEKQRGEYEKAKGELKQARLMYVASLIEKGAEKYLHGIESENAKDVIEYDNAISRQARWAYEEIDRLVSEGLSRGAGADSGILEIYEERNKMLYISARWSTLQLMRVFDVGRDYYKQKVPRRLPLLEEPCFCYDRVLETALGIEHDDGFNPNRGVTCMPPSSGKTYIANCYTCLMTMHFWLRYGESGLIRMTNNGTNAQNYGDQCAKMIEDKVFLEIFPELKAYIGRKGVVDCWKNRSTEKILLKDCNPECSDSIFMFGVEAGINGKRAMLGAVLDDLSNGLDEMDNDERHKMITDKVMSDVMDRSDDDDSPVLVQGTMYNQYDTQNTFISRWETQGMKKIPCMKFSRMTNNGKCFTCLVDIEDKEGKSIAPKLYSNTKLKEKKGYFENRGKPYVYNLIYRQKRDSREPKTFDMQFLRLYDYKENFKCLDDYATTMIDTTRKSGNDFFCMPIFRKNQVTGRYRLVDCIFEQKSLGIVDDPRNFFAKKICKKIIDRNVIECCIESNTSNTTSALLKSLCVTHGYKACKFRDRYTSRQGKGSSKVVRILNMEETIKEYIEFPDPNTLPQGHALWLFMRYLSDWSSTDGQKKSNPDDAPDSLAMYAEEFIFKRQKLGVIKEFSKNFNLF